MKKRDIANLIKYHYDKDELQFRMTASQIANDFNASGDHELASYLMSFMTDVNTFVPQSFHFESRYLKSVDETTSSLPLPTAIANDIKGIINAVNHNVGINKFYLKGLLVQVRLNLPNRSHVYLDVTYLRLILMN
jgi:hypothetical protein